MTAQRVANFEVGLLLHTRALLGTSGQPPRFDELWEDAACAEQSKFDHIWLGDSVSILNRARGDCLTTMAALACKTSRIGIGTVPLIAALRNPVLLAHSLATLDVISNGRIRVAVSVAPTNEYNERQFTACGVPFHQKAGRLSESILIMRRLWSETSFPFEGKYYRFKEIGVLPKPIQRPGIPIWIAAGDNENALRRVARHGDGWVTIPRSLEEFASCRRKIDAYAAEFGRQEQVRHSLLYVSINLDKDGRTAEQNGWDWMERFFRRPRKEITHQYAIFGTPAACADTLRRYMEAGLTGIIVRIASADQKGQMKLISDELKPRLSAGARSS
jgi:alkanesulfonate monooxygenase SsuD/methylene tetrahydromethanopterin reductase-like flavin-dependent oxidoreductase (luciferase family)